MTSKTIFRKKLVQSTVLKRSIKYVLPVVILLISSHFDRTLQVLWAQKLTHPEEFIGHPVGADYKLADWDTIVNYFYYVSKNSDRVNMRQIATTTGGQLTSSISSANVSRSCFGPVSSGPGVGERPGETGTGAGGWSGSGSGSPSPGPEADI